MKPFSDYRPEIDGLRALAVMFVILYHADLKIFKGGFIGVDIFFVISGYLITYLLKNSLLNNTFKFKDFFIRRINRLVPVLLFYLLITIFIGTYLLPPHALKDLGQALFATSIFLSNLFFFIEIDYFNATAKLSPLLHTWSLGVEEQFYIIFPFIMYFLFKIGWKYKNKVILFLIAISLYANLYYVTKDSAISFYMPFTRMWEFGFGCLLAINSEKMIWRSKFLSNALSVLGVITLLFCVYLYNDAFRYPGIFALPVVLSTCLIISFTSAGTIVHRVFCHKYFVSVGLLSYSLYISHNIIFAFAKLQGYMLDSGLEKTIGLFLTFACSIFSYKFIERPFRYQVERKKLVSLLSILGLSICATYGLFLHYSDGLKKTKLSMVYSSSSLPYLDPYSENDLRSVLWKTSNEIGQKDFSDDPITLKILILGDSKADDLVTAMISTQSDNKYEIRKIYLDDTKMDTPPNDQSNSLLELREVKDSQLLANTDLVILTATWQNHTNSGVIRFVQYLLNLGKKVIVVGTSNFNDVASLAYVGVTQEFSENEFHRFAYGQLRSDWRKQYLNLKFRLEELSESIIFWDKKNAFCDDQDKLCTLFDHGGWFIFDSGHVTIRGAEILGNFAWSELKKDF